LEEAIDVFVPAPLREYQLEERNGVFLFVLRRRTEPQFRPLEVDLVDEDGNVILRRNIGIRDLPGPVSDPRCGSYITVTLEGVLSVPFLAPVSNAPSYDIDDAATAGLIGGRYEFRVTVE